jgi:hypothetical protein
MKAKATAILLACLIAPAFSEARVDLGAVLGKDFISSPSLDQAVDAISSDDPFAGLGWEAIIGHTGFGASYLVNFYKCGDDAWWLDWDAQAAYLSYHLLGANAFLDPFVDAGLGCAGRVFLGPGSRAEGAPRLAISLYPFVSAGASVRLGGSRLGAKLSYDLDRSAIPATSIADYPLGRFQVSAFASLSCGWEGRRDRDD